MTNENNKKFKITELKNGIKIGIKVIPNSSKCKITGTLDNNLKIKLDIPPIEGKANEKCIKFLSKLLNVPKASIEIASGEKSKNKVIFIKGNSTDLMEKINSLIHLSTNN